MSPVDLQGHILSGGTPPKGFRCPQCGVQNEGLLADGCTACGSGSAKASFVGVPPVRPPRDSVPEMESFTPPPDPSTFQSPLMAAFAQWVTPYRASVTSEMFTLLLYAFKAGVAFGMGQTDSIQGGAVAMTGTAESRTVIAALRMFIEQILSQHPEECQSGEWISAEQAEAVIARLERTQ